MTLDWEKSMALRPVTKPVHRIRVNVRGDVTLNNIQHLLDSSGKKSFRGLRGLFGQMDAPGGFNSSSMDISSSTKIPKRGFRGIHVSLDTLNRSIAGQSYMLYPSAKR